MHLAKEYNVIASQIMDYKLCIVGQRWEYVLLLIGFVHLHRVVCLIHMYVQHTYRHMNHGGQGSHASLSPRFHEGAPDGIWPHRFIDLSHSL